MYWREVKKEKRGLGDCDVRIKGEDGVHERGKEVKAVWKKSHFERLMNSDKLYVSAVYKINSNKLKIC